jgi:TolB-like protein/Tfp pilus assembly protein PilF
MDIAGFIAEARRRNVFRAAGLYAGFAFVALQLADILLPAFGLAEDNVSVLLLLIALGFPLVLLGSWLVEVTPEGVRITTPISAEQRARLKSGRLVDLAIIVLALGVGFMYVERFILSEEGTTTLLVPGSDVPNSDPQAAVPVIKENSIAVLPFDNLSSSEENAFFAAGIHEDILNSLSQNPELLVTSRTSTLAFQNTTRSIADIASELDVEYIMEGSVRRAGNRVRISVQLIEAETDRHLWSEAYERTLDDIFALQVEVAEEVAAALEVQFGGPPQTPKPANSVAAYDFFIEARDLLETYEPDNLTRAIELFEAAIDADANYVDAWAGLSIALNSRRFIGGAKEGDSARTVSAAERALSLDPNNWYANSAMARYLGQQDVARFNQANRYFETAILQNPNDADLLVFYGFSLWWQGRSADAADYFSRAFRRDPLSAEANMARAMALGWRGQREDAETHLRRALRFAPNSAYIAWWAGTIYQTTLFDQFGAARQFLDSLKLNPEFLQGYAWLAGVASHLGNYETAAYWIDRARELSPRSTDVMFRTGDNLLVQRRWQEFQEHQREWASWDDSNMVGRVYASAVHRVEAQMAWDREDIQTFRTETQAALDDALTYIRDSNADSSTEVHFWNSWMFMAAGTYAGNLGDRELAHRMFRTLASYQEQEVNPDEIQLVITHAGLGDHDKAIDYLNRFIDQGFTATRHLQMYGVLTDELGTYGNIRNNVGFIDALARMNDKNAAILARLREELPDFFPPAG